jgi:hypothetical protein
MSTALYYVNHKDFALQETEPNKLNLCVKFQGYSLLLFYSKNCQHSAKLLPIFKQLPESIGGCLVGLVNIDNNRSLIEESKKTQAPISYVPLIILYASNGGNVGIPFMRYDGPADKDQIKNFVIDTASKLSKQRMQQQKAPPKQVPESNIPKYTIGLPKNSKKGATSGYGNFDSAYKSGENTNKNRNPDVSKFSQQRFN